jgi:capsular exopolysaccharide synthesis family protein
LEALSDVPVLGVVPNRLLPQDNSSHRSSKAKEQRLQEAYRLLSINLQALSKNSIPLHTFLITSAVSGEGKAIVGINLAQTLANQGKTVFLVEGDMRRPVFQDMFDIKKRPVLSALLAEPGSLNNGKLQKVYRPMKQSGLSLIPSGSVTHQPTSLLASPAMEELLYRLCVEGEITLVTAPEVLGVADASVLAAKVDGILLVVKQGYSRREQLQSALKQLQTAQARAIGIVFIQKGRSPRLHG